MSQPPANPLAQTRAMRLWRALALALAAIVAGMVFAAYTRPDLLIDVANLRYCG